MHASSPPGWTSTPPRWRARRGSRTDLACWHLVGARLAAGDPGRRRSAGRAKPTWLDERHRAGTPFLPVGADTGPVERRPACPSARCRATPTSSRSATTPRPSVTWSAGLRRGHRSRARAPPAPRPPNRRHPGSHGLQAGGRSAHPRPPPRLRQLAQARPLTSSLSPPVPVAAPPSRSAGGFADDAARADELLRLACLTYGADDPDRPRQARALLAAHPHLARASIHTAAAVGDAEAAAACSTEAPAEANRQGGPFGWEPLLYLTYSRIDSPDRAHHPVEVAHLLLAHGADANAGYLWEGTSRSPPSPAALGRGEGLAPPHRQDDGPGPAAARRRRRCPTTARRSTTVALASSPPTTPRSSSCS